MNLEILSLTMPSKSSENLISQKIMRYIHIYGKQENNEQNNIPTRKAGQKNILKTSQKSKGHKSQPERAPNGHS